jgi:hypothetical protein
MRIQYLKFSKSVNPQIIGRGLLTGLILVNCAFCRWGVILNVKSTTSVAAVIDLSTFKGDSVYAENCVKEINELLPSCYSTKIIDDKFLLIEFKDNLKTIKIGKSNE